MRSEPEQSRNRKRRNLLLAGLSVLLITIGWLLYNFLQPSSGAQLMKIIDHGSTNSDGWTLTINTNGSGSLVYERPDHTSDVFSGGKPEDRKFKAHFFDASNLQAYLTMTRLDSSYNDCMRSVSFGSVEDLIYKDKTVTGVDCYIDSQPSPLAKRLSDAIDATDNFLNFRVTP